MTYQCPVNQPAHYLTCRSLAEEVPVLGIAIASPGPVIADSDDGEDTPEALEWFGFYNRPWEWARTKANASWILQYHGEDDSVVSVEEGRRIARELGSTYTEYPAEKGRGHFLDPSFPELVDDVVRKVGELSSTALAGVEGRSGAPRAAGAGAGAGAGAQSAPVVREAAAAGPGSTP